MFGNFLGIHVTVSYYVAVYIAILIEIVGILLLLSGGFDH